MKKYSSNSKFNTIVETYFSEAFSSPEVLVVKILKPFGSIYFGEAEVRIEPETEDMHANIEISQGDRIVNFSSETQRYNDDMVTLDSLIKDGAFDFDFVVVLMHYEECQWFEMTHPLKMSKEDHREFRKTGKLTPELVGELTSACGEDCHVITEPKTYYAINMDCYTEEV